MRALVCTAEAPFAELAEAPDPTPLPNQALVDVRAFSLNRGECRRLESQTPGTLIGWYLAGLVRQAAADGSWPAEGGRGGGAVLPGAWAERATVGTEALAERP